MRDLVWEAEQWLDLARYAQDHGDVRRACACRQRFAALMILAGAAD
jgi:hypothetical protein